MWSVPREERSEDNNRESHEHYCDDGKHDDLPEQAFYLVGGIEEAIEKADKMKSEAA